MEGPHPNDLRCRFIKRTRDLDPSVYGDNALPDRYVEVTNTGKQSINNIVIDAMDVYTGNGTLGILRTYNIRTLGSGCTVEMRVDTARSSGQGHAYRSTTPLRHWKSQVVRICCDGPDGNTITQIYGAQWIMSTEYPGFYKQSSLCFVVTAAYGDENHPVVCAFRQFRDEILLRYSIGNKFVEVYNKFGPIAASAIQGRSALMFISRCILRPIAIVIATSRQCSGFMRALLK